MNISTNKLVEIVKSYFNLDDIDEDTMSYVSDAIYFVHDLIRAEISATKEKEPYAFRYIARMDEVACDLVSMECEVLEMLDDYRMASEQEV